MKKAALAADLPANDAAGGFTGWGITTGFTVVQQVENDGNWRIAA